MHEAVADGRPGDTSRSRRGDVIQTTESTPAQLVDPPAAMGGTEAITVDWGGLHFLVETGGNVFSPTSTSKFLIEMAEIKPGDAVLDLGCGVGPIAIAAALRGAEEVHAVDIMPEACEFTKRNARQNGVADRIIVHCGDLFDPVGDRQFDVIVDDVSGMAEEVARLSGWYPPMVPSGGEDGSGPTVRMLNGAGRHLKKGGVLYFPVLSLCRASEIFQTARNLFGDRVETKLTKMIPLCDALKRHIARLRELKRQGVIEFVEKKTRCLWTLQILKAFAPTA